MKNNMINEEEKEQINAIVDYIDEELIYVSNAQRQKLTIKQFFANNSSLNASIIDELGASLIS